MLDIIMEEREKDSTRRAMIEEAYEMTENRWRYLSMDDLYKALLCIFSTDSREERQWIRVESRDAKRQVEVIHILLLLKMTEPDNLLSFGRYLQGNMQCSENSIQPLYIPTEENEDPPLIDIEMDDNSHLILNVKSFTQTS